MKHLIFDCDGVLVDSEIIAAEVMTELLNQNHIPITLDFYLNECTGKTFSGLKESLSETYNQPLPDNFIEQVSLKMQREVENRLEPVKGMSSLLDSLSSYHKSVVSNSSLSEIRHSLGKTILAQHFDNSIFSSEQVEHAKPAPDIYLYAAKSLKADPADCIVVEDSLSGATAALEAGMNVIGFLGGKHIMNGHEERLKELGVKRIAHNSSELKELISSNV